MKKIFFSIKNQLTLTLLLISFATITIMNFFSFNTNIKQQTSSFVSNSIIQANLLADFSVSALAFFDKNSLNENLNKLKNNKNILQVIIYNTEKEIFVQYNPLNLHTPTSIHTTNLEQLQYEKFSSNENFKIVVPIEHNSMQYGYLYLEQSTHFLNKIQKQFFIDMAIYSSLLLLLVYIVNIIVGKYFLSPILNLVEVSTDIAKTKDYDRVVHFESSNEIGTLYKAYNSLLQETQTLTTALEDKVKQRTSELEQSLTDLKDAQTKLIESEKMSTIGNLVSGVSHEVNTPIGNALTTSSIISNDVKHLNKELEDGTLKKSTLINKINKIKESAFIVGKTLNYASDLIKSFKQISIDQVTNDIREFNLKEYINEIFLTNANKLKTQSIEVLIQGDENINIINSPGLFAQIFNNLIQNSLLHGFENISHKPQIKVNITKFQDTIQIIYSDNGSGIDENILDQIFEPFVTTKRNAGGTGLGMNIVYNIIYQRLHGNLKIESTINKGASFTITLPLKTPTN